MGGLSGATVCAILPVFRDDRIVDAVKALLKQKVRFDKIIIQDPLGEYSHLEGLCDSIFVNHETDEGLFDGIDKCIDKYKYDFYFLQGADDLLVDNDFLSRFKSLASEPDIYFERIRIVGESRVRLWPPGFFVKAGVVLPPHFGSVYKRDVLLSSRMRDFAVGGNVGADSAWFYTLDTDKLKMKYTNDQSFVMAAGGISNNSLLSPLKNLLSMEKKIRRHGSGVPLAVAKYCISSFLKLFFIRRL
ncbi:hypothetical protein [Bacterioplanoides sp.]|uniref:hypothetical protein n=1 Tax=Bacterioplanoides sp. TaxID=2066072 RepID=UPI003B5A1C42